MNQRMRKLAGTLLVMTIVGTIPNSLLADELTTTKDPIVATQDNLMIENDIENEVLETTSVSEQVENELTDARVMNYVDKEDRVIVTGVQQGDVIKVYDIAGNQIGTATIGIGWTKEDGFPVNIGEVAIGDTVGVTLTREGKTESEKLELMVGETPVTDKIKEEQVKVTNTVQGYTTLTLTGLQADTYYDGNNKVNVYDSTGKIIAFKRVSPIDEEVVINISNDSIYDGKIALSYIQDGKIESEKLELAIDEQVENELADARVMNYVDKEDRVIVTGVQQGDVIKVYDIAGNQIGTATIGIGWTKEDGFPVNIGEVAIGDTVGVTLTREGKTESEKLELMVGETPVTDKIKEEQVKVTNTVQGYTTLTLTGLQADTYYDGNNKVNVYDSTGKIIAFKRVSPIDEEVVINISNDSIYEGKIALSYIQDGKIESEKLDLIVGEQVTDKLAVDQVGVSYYSDYLYGNGYKVTVKNLQPNDIVKIYNGSGELIREAKVSTSAHEISRNVGALAEGDKIAITLTQAGKKESEKLELTYGAEVTDKVTADRVKIEYNKSSGYIVRIKGLQNGDIVKIYNEQGDVVRKASMTYGMDYMLLAVGTLPQEGTLSVTVTNPFKAESEKFEIPFETQK